MIGNEREYRDDSALNLHLASLAEKFVQKALGPLQSVLGEHHRVRLSARISNVALFVQAIHCIPIKALPSSCPVMVPEEQESQDSIIDLVCVEFHCSISEEGA